MKTPTRKKRTLLVL